MVEIGNVFEETINESNIVMPKENQVFGYLEQSMGFSKYRVRCSDRLVRLCTIPGKLRRRFKGRNKLKEGDIVIVQPWEIQSDERGDILHRYRYNEVLFLKKKGYLDDIV